MPQTDTTIPASSDAGGAIRSEVFGAERLEQHAESLAAAVRVTGNPIRGRDLLPRVGDNGRALLDAYHNVVEAVAAKREITLAEEWFLDNFHVVDQQLREIRDHLPRGYYRRLPKIAEGHLEGCPRVYALAWAYVAHSDSRFEVQTLGRFVRAYQRVQPLSIGELWAVAIHLRMVLVENLRRLSVQAVRARLSRARADELADRVLGLSARLAKDREDALRHLDDTALEGAFAVQLIQRLRDQDESVTPVLDRLNRSLSAQGTSPSAVVAHEQQEQGAANATVRNIITSMRWMSSIDWLEFFESVSLVDEELRAAPAFLAMDFATRDEYRNQVEALSRESGRSEIEVAREAVQSAENARQDSRRSAPAAEESGARSNAEQLTGISNRAEEDPGFYLVSRGRRQFEQRLGAHVPLRLRLQRLVRAHAITAYLGGIVALTILQLCSLLFVAWGAGAEIWMLALLAVLGLVPASDIATALVHRVVAAWLPPTRIPKLELAHGVPSELRTLVAVPTLLADHADIEEQLERLEVHYLANSEGDLYFALLTDWPDALCEHTPSDASLLAALADGIDRLNTRYEGPPDGGERFLLLHRRRLWNEQEGKWIGWERKRGKLHELNRLLRGALDTTFISIRDRAPAIPKDVRYVITLDADTRLPKGTAYRLVGAMAHPLNRPQFDPLQGRVVNGHAVMQPRITPSLPTGPGATAYQRIVSGRGGVDPYAAAVSDVYQDLFGEGSFTGKGIYDVDAFEASLDRKIPENALLSHDLFEGLFARAGLVTDVALFEEFPSSYEVAARRQHRWVRGDWQLLPWVTGRARHVAGQTQRTLIQPVGRWKMIDNLRRSLAAPSSLLLAVAAWTLPGVPALLWTLLFVGSVAVPASIPVLDGLIPRRWGVSKRSHVRAVTEDIVLAMSQTFLAITMLGHQAWLMVDAVLRTLWRLYVTKRNLLEWVPAAQSGQRVGLGLRASYRHLRWGVVVAAGAALLFIVFKPGAWPVATPFVVVWGLSPLIAWRTSLPPALAQARVLSPK